MITIADVKDFIEVLTDNFLAVMVLGAGLFFVHQGIPVPEFLAVILGMAAMHYFKKTK